MNHMAIVDALEREKKQKKEEQRPQPRVEIPQPMCKQLGCLPKMNSNPLVCFWCGRPM